jgi:ParB/RepB/Spo0J family partition protein
MSTQKLKLSKITGFARDDGKNTREHFENLGMDEVLFKTELVPTYDLPLAEGEVLPEGESPKQVVDNRQVLRDLAWGDTATEETKADFVKRLRKEPALWAFAQELLTDGQLQAIGVVHSTNGEYNIVWGARRFIAKTAAHIMSPEISDDEIEVKVLTVDQVKAEQFSVAENTFRKALSPVDLGRQAARLNKVAGLSYKDIASKLGLFQKSVKGQPPKPNQQQARNFALLHDDKVTDQDRQDIADGKKGYTAILVKRGLIKKVEATDGADETEAGNSKARAKAKTLGEMKELLLNTSKLTKLAESMDALEGIERVRFIISKMANQRYKALPVATEDDAA